MIERLLAVAGLKRVNQGVHVEAGDDGGQTGLTWGQVVPGSGTG